VHKPLRLGLAAALAASVTLLLAQAAINDDVEDPAVWGKVFPLHYELYKKTVDMERTKYGGSEAVRQGQLALRDKDFKPTVPVVDIPNK
jgi:hypothetical protein